MHSVVSSFGRLRARAFDQPAPTELKGHTALVYSLAFSPDGKLLATASFDNTIKFWAWPEGKESRTLTGHTGNVYCIAFNKEGTTLASSSLDQSIRLWDVAEGKSIREIKGHTGIVDSVTFSPDGKMLASGSADKSVRLWNPEDGKEVKNLGTHANSVYSVAFSPDGKYLASGGADNLVKLWDVAGQKLHKELKGHTAAVTGVLFTPDSASVLSISQDRFLRQWDANEGTETRVLGRKPEDGKGDDKPKVEPMPDDLYGIALARDGKALATSGYAGYLTVWDLAEGKPTWTRKLKAFGAYCVAFTPDGKALVTGHDNSVCYVTPINS
jgi:WD40 repeat protein